MASTTTTVVSEAVHHWEQSRSNRCVPACACMICSRLGRPTAEDAVCDACMGSKRGYALVDVATVIGGHPLQTNPDLPESYDFLRARLAEPRWIIAQMFSRPLMLFTEAMREPPTSRHGRLSREPFGELHAIVLVRADVSEFVYLDPYYPDVGQPFTLGNEAFAEAWQGEIVISPPLPG